MRDNEACRPLVIETLKFLYDLDMDETKELDLSHPLARPRIPHDILFVIGGWSGGSPTNVIETYDTRADRWVLCESTDKGQFLHARCVWLLATLECLLAAWLLRWLHCQGTKKRRVGAERQDCKMQIKEDSCTRENHLK